MLRGVADTEMPWLGFFLGQTPASIWYWCSDQVGIFDDNEMYLERFSRCSRIGLQVWVTVALFYPPSYGSPPVIRLRRRHLFPDIHNYGFMVFSDDGPTYFGGKISLSRSGMHLFG